MRRLLRGARTRHSRSRPAAGRSRRPAPARSAAPASDGTSTRAPAADPEDDDRAHARTLGNPPRARGGARADLGFGRDPLHEPVTDWYAAAARDLPWRRPGTEPVGGDGHRVHAPADAGRPGAARSTRPGWQRWPTPAALAADARRRGGPGLGPARLPAPGAAAARAPRPRSSSGTAARCRTSYDDLLRAARRRRLHRRRGRVVRLRPAARVLDTNVRRVLARAVGGRRVPGAAGHRGPSATLADVAAAPDEPTAATWAVAVMELGALVCTARATRAAALPGRRPRAPGGWPASPAYDGPPRRGQTYAGTDRQCRGRLLAVLRATTRRPGARVLDAAWPDGRPRPERWLARADRGLADACSTTGLVTVAATPAARTASLEAAAARQVAQDRLVRGRSRRDSAQPRPAGASGSSGGTSGSCRPSGREREGLRSGPRPRRRPARSGRGRPRRRASSRRARPRSRAGWCGAAAAHRAPGRSPRAASRSLAAWVSSMRHVAVLQPQLDRGDHVVDHRDDLRPASAAGTR